MFDIVVTSTKFPKLAKLTSLSISHSPKLLEIGDGAFQELAALQHFDCQHNLHLQSIHQHAFVRPGEDAKQHGVWPPIRSVSNKNPKNNAIFICCLRLFIIAIHITKMDFNGRFLLVLLLVGWCVRVLVAFEQ